MDLQLDAPVVSHDGAELGKISRVIFDPQSGETKSVVIRTGGIFGREVAAPLEEIRVAAPTRVELEWDKHQFDDQPSFVDTEYAWPPETWVAPYGWPAGAVMWPAPYGAGMPVGVPVMAGAVPGEVREDVRREDDNAAVVGHGAEVVAMNGEKVGSVDNVMIDPVSHKPSRVMLKRGFLFTEDVELPGDWISSYDDQRVVLNVDKVTVEQLAKHQQH